MALPRSIPKQRSGRLQSLLEVQTWWEGEGAEEGKGKQSIHEKLRGTGQEKHSFMEGRVLAIWGDTLGK